MNTNGINGQNSSGSSRLPLSVFESSRKPHKKRLLANKKIPYIYKKKPQEQLISIESCKIQKKPKDVQLEKLLKLESLLSEPKNDVASLKDVPVSLLPQQIIKGHMDSTKLDDIRIKYALADFPLPKSKTELKKRVACISSIIPKLLNGEEELSYHYTLALEQRKSLKNTTMSSSERWDISWEKYIGGFYGLRRQSFISTLIQTEFATLLRENRNKTIAYWSPDMFSTYVLANEIILRLVMDDMKLLKKEAEQLLRDTVDFGSHLADEREFADDLAFEEFQVL